MPSFSRRSKDKLETCDSRLQDIMQEVIKHYDCTILEGHRDEATQDEYFRTGRSKVEYPNSKHNSYPSKAIDVVPYPIDWNDKERFYHFGGFVKGIAAQMGIKLRWGGDWNSNNDFKDQTFHDLPHFEILE